MNSTLFLCALLALGSDPKQESQDPRKWDIHLEGEDATQSNLLPNPWLAPAQLPHPEILSGGDWLTGKDQGKGKAPRAIWEFEVQKRGRYQIWVRKFWRHGPFDWRIGKGPFRSCGRERPLVGTRALKPFVSLCWVPMGWVNLPKGKQSLELRFHKEKGRRFICGIDAFVLRQRAFIPQGDGKRNKDVPLPPGWFAYQPGNRPPRPGSPLNLRGRNEKRAGAKGWIRRKKEDFIDGAGKPIRFWGVNLTPDIWLLDGESQSLLARRLAAAGVNLARLHGDPLSGKRLPGLRRLVDKLADQGIYSCLSFYFHLWHRDAKGNTPLGRLFFDPKEQARHWESLSWLLNAKSPTTGLRLAEEPALAWVELVNEDSLLFWSLDRIQGKARALLEKRLGSKLVPAWQMTSKGETKQGKAQALALAKLQTEFYARTMARARKELGLRSLMTASNWKTADPIKLGPLEQKSYKTGDLLDRHLYFGPRVQGPRSSFAVAVGQSYQDRSFLKEPQRVERAFRNRGGFPQVISELGWPSPNRYQAEAPMTIATTSTLNGIDAPILFAVSTPGFEEGLQKFPVQIPALFAQFPAAALVYRRGDLRSPKNLHWDGNKAVLLFQSRRSAGAVGALGKAGSLHLGPLKLSCHHSFAALWIVALDDRSLDRSKKILIHILPEQQYRGFKKEGSKIVSLGQGPWMLREIDLSLRFPKKRFHEALFLDVNGDLRERRDIPGKTLRLPKDCLYTVLR